MICRTFKGTARQGAASAAKSAAPHPPLRGCGCGRCGGFQRCGKIEIGKGIGVTIEPDFKTPNREPVISLMDLARLDDEARAEGYRDGAEGLPCGGNRSRSYWHGWRNGARDGGHRDRNGDFWDSMLTSNVVAGGSGIVSLGERIEACRKILREAGEFA